MSPCYSLQIYAAVQRVLLMCCHSDRFHKVFQHKNFFEPDAPHQSGTSAVSDRNSGSIWDSASSRGPAVSSARLACRTPLPPFASLAAAHGALLSPPVSFASHCEPPLCSRPAGLSKLLAPGPRRPRMCLEISLSQFPSLQDTRTLPLRSNAVWLWSLSRLFVSPALFLFCPNGWGASGPAVKQRNCAGWWFFSSGVRKCTQVLHFWSFSFSCSSLKCDQVIKTHLFCNSDIIASFYWIKEEFIPLLLQLLSVQLQPDAPLVSVPAPASSKTF